MAGKDDKCGVYQVNQVNPQYKMLDRWKGKIVLQKSYQTLSISLSSSLTSSIAESIE